MANAAIFDLLQCSICHEMLADPRALPCGHSFCGPPRTCLDGIKHNNNQASKCAECNQVFPVKVNELKPLYKIRDALGRLAVAENNCAQGADCNHNDVKMWCKDCSVKLCIACVEKNHKYHNLKSYKAILREKAQTMVPILKDIDFQTYRLANEIKQLQTIQKNIEELSKNKSLVKQIAEGGDVNLTAELRNLLDSNSMEKYQWYKTKLSPFEFLTTIEHIPLDFNTAVSFFSPSYQLRDYNFTVQCDLKKIDDESWCGLFLKVAPVQIAEQWRIKLKYRITLVNREPAKNKFYDFIEFEFGNNSTFCSYGHPKFIKFKQMINYENGFLTKPASITIKVEIKELEL